MLLLLAAVSAGVGWASASASGGSGSGLQLGLMWSGDLTESQSETEWDLIGASGSTVYKVPIEMGRTAGGTDWSTYDAIFEAAWRHRITVLPGLTGSATGRFPVASEFAGWDAWAREVVERYGVGGTFWAGKPDPMPVSAWEIWNEPNLPENNPEQPPELCEAEGLTYSTKYGTCVRPELYGAFLASAAAEIHAQGDAQGGTAEVIFGGLYGGPLGTEGGEAPVPYLVEASEAADADSFDGVAIHPYAFDRGLPKMASTIDELHSALANEEVPDGSDKSIWITELGWPVGGIDQPTVSPEEQAAFLDAGFEWIKGKAEAYDIRAALWYNLRDRDDVANWAYHSGLLEDQGHPTEFRPSWSAFLEQTGGSGYHSAPAAFTAADGTQNVFIADGGAIDRYSRAPGGTWTPETVATGPFASAPVAFESAGVEYVFAVGNGGLDVYSRTAGGAWLGEQIAAGAFTSAPAAYVDASGTAHAFLDAGGGIDHYAKAPGGVWLGETVATGAFTSIPAAYVDPSGTEHLFAQTRGEIDHYSRAPGGAWLAEVAATGTFTSAPAAFADPGGAQTVLAATEGGIARYLAAPGTPFGGGTVASGAFTSAPSAFVDPGGTQNLFVTTGGGINHYLAGPGGTFAGEIVATGEFTSAPAAYLDATGAQQVFVDTDRGIDHYSKSPGGGWSEDVVATFP